MPYQLTNLTTRPLTVGVNGVPQPLAPGQSVFTGTLAAADRSAQLRGELISIEVPQSSVALADVAEKPVHPAKAAKGKAKAEAEAAAKAE